MGSSRQKKRKKRAKFWDEFQLEFELPDTHIAMLQKTGYPLERIKADLLKLGESVPLPERISQLHEAWKECVRVRNEQIAAGLIKPKARENMKEKHDPAWAKAKKVCRLNMEDIRMAKELGMSPRSLMKNIPSPTQQWKAPVKDWIRDLYEEGQEKAARKAARRESPPIHKAPVDSKEESADDLPF